MSLTLLGPLGRIVLLMTAFGQCCSLNAEDGFAAQAAADKTELEERMSSRIEIKLRPSPNPPEPKEAHEVLLEFHTKGELFDLFNPWLYPFGPASKGATIAVFDADGAFIRHLEDRRVSRRVSPTASMWTSIRDNTYLGVKYRFPSWALWKGSSGAATERETSRFKLQAFLFDRGISRPCFGPDGKLSVKHLKKWRKMHTGRIIARSEVIEIVLDDDQ